MTDPHSGLGLREEDLEGIAAYYDQLTATVIAESENGSMQQVPEDFAVYVARLRLGLKAKRHCGAGLQMLVVSPEGDFYPCPGFVANARFRMGTLGNGIDGEGGTGFRNLTVDEKTACQRCWARNLCGGGCALQAFHRSGHLGSPDAFECSLTKTKIKGAIAMYHHLKTRFT